MKGIDFQFEEFYIAKTICLFLQCFTGVSEIKGAMSRNPLQDKDLYRRIS
jgi:hypothetical protein